MLWLLVFDVQLFFTAGYEAGTCFQMTKNITETEILSGSRRENYKAQVTLSNNGPVAFGR